jgi:hypothetical protein
MDSHVRVQKDTLSVRESNVILFSAPFLTSTDSIFASVSINPASKFEQQINEQNSPEFSHDTLHNTPLKIVSSFNNENPALQISGNLINTGSRQPVKNAIVFLSFPDTVLRFRYSITNNHGAFCFSLPQGYNKNTAFLSAFSFPGLTPIKKALFRLNEPFIKNTAHSWGTVLYAETLQNPDSLNVKKAVIKKAYQTQNLKQKAAGNSIHVPYEHRFMLGERTNQVFIDDYIPLPDFYEISREILPFVRFRYENGAYRMYVIDGEMKLLRPNPMVWADGVPVTDLDKIAPLNSKVINQIDVKSNQRLYGDIFLQNGAVLIWTKGTGFWKKNSIQGVQKVQIQNYQKQVKMQFPEYNQPVNSNEPDFRQTLYWSPNVAFASGQQHSVAFFTSDETGEFVVTIMGVTSAGNIFRVNKTFVVK